MACQVNVGETWVRKDNKDFTVKITKVRWRTTKPVWQITGNVYRQGKLASSGYVKEEAEFLTKWALLGAQALAVGSPGATGMTTQAAIPKGIGGVMLDLGMSKAAKPVHKKGSACTCGGAACGYKDFTRQHFQWCDVYKGD